MQMDFTITKPSSTTHYRRTMATSWKYHFYCLILHGQPMMKTKVKEDTFNLPIQVNGKLRASIDIPINLSEIEVSKIAKEQITSYIDGKEIVKEIYIKK